MRYRSTVDIEQFDFTGSPVRSVAVNGDQIKLSLRSGKMLKGHPQNPRLTAQSIEPCTLTFIGFTRSEPMYWSADARRYVSHPEPDAPLRDDLGTFETEPTDSGYTVTISGFHPAGAVRWTLDCAAIEVAWDDFTGSTWFDNGPLNALK